MQRIPASRNARLVGPPVGFTSPPEPENYDGEPCECGACEWGGDPEDGARCLSCGTGAFEPNVIHERTTPVAAKRYNVGRRDEIDPGERHECVKTRGHFPGGSWGPWVTVRRPLMGARTSYGPKHDALDRLCPGAGRDIVRALLPVLARRVAAEWRRQDWREPGSIEAIRAADDAFCADPSKQNAAALLRALGTHATMWTSVDCLMRGGAGLHLDQFLRHGRFVSDYRARSLRQAARVCASPVEASGWDYGDARGMRFQAYGEVPMGVAA